MFFRLILAYLIDIAYLCSKKQTIMSNTNIDNRKYKQTVNIKPACCGLLQKSHPHSFFKRFHINSDMAEWVLSDTPCLKQRTGCAHYEKYMDVVVLQIMSFGDNELLCELVDAKEFEADGK